MTTNQLSYQSLKESQRANLARETENERSNRAQEGQRLATLEENKFQYRDMAGWEKAVKAGQVAQSTTQAARNVAETVYTAKKIANPLSGIVGS